MRINRGIAINCRILFDDDFEDDDFDGSKNNPYVITTFFEISTLYPAEMGGEYGTIIVSGGLEYFTRQPIQKIYDAIQTVSIQHFKIFSN